MSRVLVVDDEAPIRRALGINLRARGYEVDLAETGEEALELCEQHAGTIFDQAESRLHAQKAILTRIVHTDFVGSRTLAS